jgi:hypothetical protein
MEHKTGGTEDTTTLVGAGFLHQDNSISGNTKTGGNGAYTVTFTPGSGSGTNAAGNAASSSC